MGMIGRWIDTLSDVERDAIIQHSDPTFSGRTWWSYDSDCGCLVGCVVDLHARDAECRGYPFTVRDAGIWTDEQVVDANGVGGAFFCFACRVTPEVAWALVKARAARLPLPAQPAVQSTERLELTEVMGD